MRLRIRTLPSAAIPGAKRALVLCDEAGEPLPRQTGLTLEQRVGELSRVVVTLLVDGSDVVLDEGAE